MREEKGDGNRMVEIVFESIYKEIFPFWETIPDTDREYICRNSYRVAYPKGKNIHDGAECSGVILVCSGSLRLYIMSDEGKEITLYRLHRGDLCMLSASCVLDAITFEVFVDAEEDSECCVVSGPAFAAVSGRNPDVHIFALETAVSRFSDVMWVMQQIYFAQRVFSFYLLAVYHILLTVSVTKSHTAGTVFTWCHAIRSTKNFSKVSAI